MNTTPVPSKPVRTFFDWITPARVRSTSGLVLMVYVTCHLVAHSFGLLSQEALSIAGETMRTVWRWLPLTVVLYAALAAHFGSALFHVYQRRALKMRAREWFQLVLGILIPLLLVSHVMGTRYASARYGINDSYAYVLLSTFVFSPVNGYLNAAGLVASWVHGCIGVHMWARYKQWYSRSFFNWGLVFATLLPITSLAGYLSAGRRIVPFASDGEWLEVYYEKLKLSSDDVWTWIAQDTEFVRNLLIAIIVLVFAARVVRSILQSRGDTTSISYFDGPVLNKPNGPTLLEHSLSNDVPHASVCGGRGRCSTCRVRILESDFDLDPPDENEARVLERINAASDVRLACQIRPAGKMKVMRLLPSEAKSNVLEKDSNWASGRERVVTVMFVDLRDFTGTSENKLPFDVVYLINQFSRTMGIAVEGHNGRIDKFLGDGFMALFGVNETDKQGARNALAATEAMIAELSVLNERLQGDLAKPLRMGVGLHAGNVILGEMGYGSARGLTALGETVNLASRLESATKEQKCAVCVSQATLDVAEFTSATLKPKRIGIRGLKSKVEMYAIEHPDDLDIVENNGNG